MLVCRFLGIYLKTDCHTTEYNYLNQPEKLIVQGFATQQPHAHFSLMSVTILELEYQN